MKLTELLNWKLIAPILAWIYYFSGVADNNGFFSALGGILLILSVLCAVHHAEVVAHRVGEPFGTIILAIAITVLEVAIIVSLMFAGGDQAVTLARDTVFAAVMILLNGILGICLIIGSAKYHEQFFGRTSANTALISLISILVLTLILPNYTTSVRHASYTESQLFYVSFACLMIYGTFLMIQTVRHRNYFLSNKDDENHSADPPSNATTITSFVFLLLCLGIVVLLAKALSPAIEQVVKDLGAPESLVGIIIAAVVLLPEGLAALNAAKKNRIQTSLNLVLGSALASIGLTIPVVAAISIFYDLPLLLGLDIKSMILLGLSFAIVMLALNRGKTNILYGVVLLVNFLTYVFTVIVP